MSSYSFPVAEPPPLAAAAGVPQSQHHTTQNHPSLTPLITTPSSSRRSANPRPMSHASKNRLSQYSTGSVPSRSRPASHVFPTLQSSLPYSNVRDFAYPSSHPLHYGPPPEPSRPPSGMTTPASETRRLSDTPTSWEGGKMGWDWTSDGGLGKGSELAPIHFGDGPPYSEDEDLQSPVVSSRHRKHKSTSALAGRGSHTSRDNGGPSSITNASGGGSSFDANRGYYNIGTSSDGNERYYVSQGGEANGPGGEFVTYHPGQTRRSVTPYQPSPDQQQPRRYAEHEAGYRSGSDASSAASSPGLRQYDESRYSRDYQFTITSPDEEMHGKAVALFDFERENENELPLFEGQIIWVSYRHGQGWLVAEDPKTQESGLVPEEYVRLLRDIEGGMISLTGQLDNGGLSTPNDAGTPTQAEHTAPVVLPQTTHVPQPGHGHIPTGSLPTNGYHQPVVSTFSTSSKDLDPYPQHLLGQHGQHPPQVVHYHGQRGGSQANTPTAQNSFGDTPLGGGSGAQDAKPNNWTSKTQAIDVLPQAKMKSAAHESDSEDEDRQMPQKR